MKKKITFGIPCFNEELNVEHTYKALKKITAKLPRYSFEYIFVDNGSSDNTRERIRKIARKDKAVKGIFLSRNFGPESSGDAVLDHATGDGFIFVECDLQDPPELIPTFVKKWEDGYDLVLGVRCKIEDNFVMTVLRKSFYRMFRSISNIDVPVNTGSFGLIDKKVLVAIRNLPERYRFFRGLRAWVGFNTYYIPYNRRARERGTSSYNLFDYFRHAERSLVGFSYVPLDMIIYLGLLLVLLSFLAVIVYLIYVFLFGNPIKGSITIFISILLFGGIQLLAISTIGKYIQVIVEEVKRRPLYIVDEKVNVAGSK